MEKEYYMRYLKSMLFKAAVALSALLFLSQTQNANAQSTLFNIPSTDVVAEKHVYLEFDFVSHLESYSNSGFQAYVGRGVVGLGKKFEAGVNVAFARTGSPNPVEIQPNVKYQAYSSEKHGVAVSTGAILYAPITRRTGTNTFGMLYANVSKQMKGKYGPRLTGGGYGLVNRASGTGQKGGAIAGYEQPLHPKVKFVADWFSGNNRFGYLTPGFSFATSKTGAIYAGYNIGNNGRKNNSLYIYYGITF